MKLAKAKGGLAPPITRSVLQVQLDFEFALVQFGRPWPLSRRTGTAVLRCQPSSIYIKNRFKRARCDFENIPSRNCYQPAEC